MKKRAEHDRRLCHALYHPQRLHAAQISSLGAQLMHLTGKTEYLWQGDPAYWTDRAPTIFPYVARLTNGTYRYEGQTYHLPIHGLCAHGGVYCGAENG